MEANSPDTSRPTLTDIDEELLRNILVEEGKYFQLSCSKVDGSRTPLEVAGEESNSPIVKIAASFLRYDIVKKLGYKLLLI